MRFTRAALATSGALVSLVGCAAILGIEPTDVIGGDGGPNASDGNVLNDGAPAGDGAATGDGGPGSTPAFSTACALSLVVVDPNGAQANAIVADDNGLFWATIIDSDTSTISARVGGVTTNVAGDSIDEPTVIGLALDSTNLYWTSWKTYNNAFGPPHVRAWSRSSHQIINADLSEAGVGVSEITLAGSRLFFGNWLTQSQNAHLWSLPAPFSDGAKPQDESGGLQSPLHFASDSTSVYYDEATSDLTKQDQVAFRSQFGGANEIDTNADEVRDLVVGGAGRVYWAQTNDKKIQTHLPDFDSGTDTLFSSPSVYPQLLTYDADHHMLYVINSTTDNTFQVQRISTTDPSPNLVMCVDGLTDGNAIQYWNGHVYFSIVSDHSGSGLFDLTIK
jgi:hypothetical protein